MIYKIIFVALGGAFGAAFRYAVTHYVNTGFPGTAISHWGTLAVNLVGSLLIGVVFETVQSIPHFNHIWLLIAVGFCGAFTTYSSYALEVHNQLAAGFYEDAMLNFLLNNTGCVSVAFAGIYAAKLVKGLL